MTPADDPKSKRRSIRFAPDAGTYAKVDLEATRLDGSFQPTVVALVPEESTKGVGLIVLNMPGLQVGSFCRVQVGQLSPLQAEVRWRKVVDNEILRIGLQYLE
jgi:hypothetical protein